jgi:tight adherence protein B
MEVSASTLSWIAAFIGWDIAVIFLLWRFGPAPRKGDVTRLYQELDGSAPAPRQSWLQSMRDGVDRTQLPARHLRLYTALIWLLVFGLAFLVMKRVLVAAGVASFVFLYPRYYLNQLIRSRREVLNDQMRQVLLCLVNSLRSGASLEVAIERCPDDLRKLLAGRPHKPMLYEMEQLVHELKMGHSLDDALGRLRERVNLEDMDDLVNALQTARITGGNLVEIMERVAQAIGDRIEVRGQVRVLTAGKRFEVTTLTVTPLGMIVLLNLIPGYMEPLYDHPVGQLLAIAGVGCLVAAFFWGRRLAEIEL